MSSNDITGDALRTKAPSKAYDAGYDRIFGKSRKPDISSNGISTLINMLESFRCIDDDFTKRIPVQAILVFCYAKAINEANGTCNVKDISKKLGMSNASASRNLHYMTEDGLGLLQAIENPERRNEKIVALTDEGCSLVEKLDGSIVK